jgi:hypothetical protein
MAVVDTFPHCHEPLIEIDHYGERLIDCIECGRWGLLGPSCNSELAPHQGSVASERVTAVSGNVEAGPSNVL